MTTLRTNVSAMSRFSDGVFDLEGRGGAAGYVAGNGGKGLGSASREGEIAGSYCMKCVLGRSDVMEEEQEEEQEEEGVEGGDEENGVGEEEGAEVEV